MSRPAGLRLATRSAEETEALGARLAAALPPSPQPLIVYLSGDLGAGKTTLARGFTRECGFSGAVKSPTYTLIESHAGRAVTIVHLDLYRLREPAELESLGIRDLLLPAHVWLIEWPERGAGRLPPADLNIALSVEPDRHGIEVQAVSQRGIEWLKRAGCSEGAPRFS